MQVAEVRKTKFVARPQALAPSVYFGRVHEFLGQYQRQGNRLGNEAVGRHVSQFHDMAKSVRWGNYPSLNAHEPHEQLVTAFSQRPLSLETRQKLQAYAALLQRKGLLRKTVRV